MTDEWELPTELRGTYFTTAQAIAAGLSQRRLESDRVRSLHVGVWADATAELSIQDRARAALLSTDEASWISHATAAQVHGMWLPPRLRELDRVDVTTGAPQHAPRGHGIRGRQRWLKQSAVEMLDGIRVTTPAQTFVDGTDYLALEDLVSLGDSMLTDGSPLADPVLVRSAIREHRGRRGHRRLLEAARLVTVRSRSRSETVSRLVLRSMGVPEAWWNVPIRLGDIELAPDAAFWPAGVVIEVEGDQHRVDRAQWLRDIDRYNLYQRHGIEPHRLVVTSLAATRERLRPIVEHLRRRWSSNRPVPPIAPWFTGRPSLPEGWLLDDA